MTRLTSDSPRHRLFTAQGTMVSYSLTYSTDNITFVLLGNFSNNPNSTVSNSCVNLAVTYYCTSPPRLMLTTFPSHLHPFYPHHLSLGS